MTHNVFWLAVRMNSDEKRKTWRNSVTSGLIEFWKGEMKCRYKTLPHSAISNEFIYKQYENDTLKS